MKIFLTGGTGFLGSHFLNDAEASRHQITAVRRPGSKCCIAGAVEPFWLEQPLDQITPNHLDGCDVLVHFASVGVSPKQATWEDLFYWNVLVTVRLAKAAKDAGVRRIVAAGSFAEYGKSADRFDPIPPDAPLEPTYGYSASKAASFQALLAFAQEHKIDLAYLRIFSAFGLGQYEGNFWSALRKAALSGGDFEMTAGEQVRDYIPVEKVASILWKVTLSEILPRSPLVANVGSGQATTMRRFAEEWWAKFNAKGKLKIGALPYRANEVMRFVPIVSPL